MPGQQDVGPAFEYFRDAWQRSILFLDVLRQRGNIYQAQQEKSVNVEVASAFPLPDALADKLAQALRGKLQREVSINTVVDQSLLGGVVVRAGDVVIDGSVRGRLAKLARAMNS